MSERSGEQLSKNISRCKHAILNACTRSGRSVDEITIVAASKTHDSSTIRSAFELGVKDFGENYVQEWQTKQSEMQDLSDLRWHFIGHLQRNKVRFVVPGCSFIHSVDSFDLAKEISKYSLQHACHSSILFQVNSSHELSKSGLPPDEVFALVEACASLPNISLRGLMCIPEAQEDAEEVRPEFRMLSEMQTDIRNRLSLESFTELSMGMSSDFEVAIEEGATMIRLGTVLFGERDYSG